MTWLLHLTGGEPFAYPGFVDLCELLTVRHLISINTNADLEEVASFAKRIAPDRVDFINCGSHPEQRFVHSGIDRFVRNVRLLTDMGFDAFVSCVMYPPLFADFPDLWQRYAAQGVVLIPKALQGEHLGRSFPQGYTEAERRIFIAYSNRAEEAYAARRLTRRAPPTIDPFLDRDTFPHGLTDYRGKQCRAGRDFVRIRPEGTIVRCGPDEVIGSIVDGSFARQEGPTPCAAIECPYFCEKYRVP